jgi:hypothetical protein
MRRFIILNTTKFLPIIALRSSNAVTVHANEVPIGSLLCSGGTAETTANDFDKSFKLKMKLQLQNRACLRRQAIETFEGKALP